MRNIWVGAILAASISAASADQLEDAKVCSGITDSLHRLTCFDRIFPSSETEPEVEASDQSAEKIETIAAPKWEIMEEKSALDDSPTVMAYLQPSKISGTGIGQSEMLLMLRCYENTTGAVLSTDMYMTGDTARVTLRFGEDPAETARWNVSSNRKGAGLWSGSQAIPFIKRLATHGRLVVRVENRDRTDAEFDLGNVRDVAEKISTACNWKLD